MSWVTSQAVAPELAADLVTGWTARVQGQHRLVPDGCVDVLWIDNGTTWVCGPETAAWTFTLPPGTEAVGVRFQPGRAGEVLGFDTAEVRNTRVRLEDVVGARGERIVAEQLGDAREPAARLATLQRHARGWLSGAPDRDPAAHAVARLLGRNITTPVAALADAVALSERQLHRRCVAAFGYGPATLRRILRLQRFIRLANHPAAPTDLAGLATLAGYTDQPHLSHECRTIAGVSPRELIGRPQPVRSVHDTAVQDAAALAA
ncbi:MAG: helix-turn-helix domain-containing protein [Actinomycetota bacterium]